jgi:hypothetical protein
MTQEGQGRQKRRSKLWIAALALTILVAIIVIPPLVSINRYKGQIARAMSSSLGRPVHLSAVELRLLPRPGFVITNLTVEEDPAYGAEPVLQANEVKAAIRLFSVWRGRLEISRISVDEASLNLVRTPEGQWNIETLFRTAAQSRGDGRQQRPAPLPYLEATNSRINIKRGIEKLPYSLVNADLSFWEENPGDWRVRLKGQPARTDVTLDLGDTGIMQLEARMRRAPELRLMPVHIELEWREAQLGQLSRLLIGSDPGWRGDLTADMKLDGTAESAQVVTRLRASGVHRAEFAPAVPLDFDANCGFTYHYSVRSIEKLACNSPLGEGRLLLEGNLPSGGAPRVALELQKLPAQAILDLLRTVRSEVGAGLEADGTLSGELTYDASLPSPPPHASGKPARHGHRVTDSKQVPVAPGPLTGSISLEGLRLTGGTLNQPIQIQKAVLEPARATDGNDVVLSGTANVPAGAATPLEFTTRITLKGYQISVRGAGTPARLQQMAQAAGLKEAGALNSIAGDPATLDLQIAGPWLPAPEPLTVESTGSAEPTPLNGESDAATQQVPDRLSGTVTLHNANWKTDALATAVQIPQAILHLNGGTRIWDPVAFAYGPLKGTARLVIPMCDPEQQCLPMVSLEFPELNASQLQSTLLGSEKKGTLLSSVIQRLTPSSDHNWPAFQGTVKTDSLVMGPVTLEDVTADVKVLPTNAELTSIDAAVLGGQIHLTGSIASGDKPAYSLEGQFEQVNPADLCRLLELKCAGTRLDGNGKIELTGYSGKDLASSAKGVLHYDWKRGAITGRIGGTGGGVPPALARFDSWSADAEIANGAVTLGSNQIKSGARTGSVTGTITLGEPPKVSFSAAKTSLSEKK